MTGSIQGAPPSLPPHVQLIQMGTGGAVANVVHIAAKLGLADKLADGPKSAVELAGPLALHAPSLHRLMRTMASLGLLTEGELLRFSLTICGKYTEAKVITDELVLLADEKGALQWKALGLVNQGLLAVLTGGASEAVQVLASGIDARRSTGATVWLPLYLSHLSTAHAELRRFDEAWHCVGDAMTAMETTKETWCEAEVHRMVGEIALMSEHPDAAKAETHFDHASVTAAIGEASSSRIARQASAPTAPEPAPKDTAERRQVTVMFSDLVGSTALSRSMDPEDLREVISAYQNCVAGTVKRFGGFVAKYMGDGSWSISAIPRRTRMMPSGRCGRGWSWSQRSVH